MKTLQKDSLEPFTGQNEWNMQWHDSLDDLPADSTKFTILVAHEFFDALPFHLIQVCNMQISRCHFLTNKTRNAMTAGAKYSSQPGSTLPQRLSSAQTSPLLPL